MRDFHFVNAIEIDYDNVYVVKVRYRLQDTPCRIKIIDLNVLEVDLLEPLAMIARGQTAVFYDNDRLVGGGFISESK